MADPRLEKLANIMVHYALELQPGQQFWLRTTPLAEELNLAVYEEAVRAGAHVFIDQRMPGSEELFFKHASDDQLDFVSPVRKLIADTFDASLYIEARHNSRHLSGIDGWLQRFSVQESGLTLEHFILKRLDGRRRGRGT